MGCLFYADGGGFRATDEQDQPLQEVYHMGVIDILTPYNIKKRIEHGFKSLTHDSVRVCPPRFSRHIRDARGKGCGSSNRMSCPFACWAAHVHCAAHDLCGQCAPVC